MNKINKSKLKLKFEIKNKDMDDFENAKISKN